MLDVQISGNGDKLASSRTQIKIRVCVCGGGGGGGGAVPFIKHICDYFLQHFLFNCF